MPILSLAISKEGMAKLKIRARQEGMATVREHCIWVLAADAEKVKPALSKKELEPVAEVLSA